MEKAEKVNKEKLFKLWAYDAEVKMWADRKEKLSQSDLEMINKLWEQSERDRAELIKFITCQKDPYIRGLLTYRCVDRKQWKEIAQLLGGSPNSHRMALSRFISEM